MTEDTSPAKDGAANMARDSEVAQLKQMIERLQNEKQEAKEATREAQKDEAAAKARAHERWKQSQAKTQDIRRFKEQNAALCLNIHNMEQKHIRMFGDYERTVLSLKDQLANANVNPVQAGGVSAHHLAESQQTIESLRATNEKLRGDFQANMQILRNRYEVELQEMRDQTQVQDKKYEDMRKHLESQKQELLEKYNVVTSRYLTKTKQFGQCIEERDRELRKVEALNTEVRVLREEKNRSQLDQYRGPFSKKRAQPCEEDAFQDRTPTKRRGNGFVSDGSSHPVGTLTGPHTTFHQDGAPLQTTPAPFTAMPMAAPRSHLTNGPAMMNSPQESDRRDINQSADSMHPDQVNNLFQEAQGISPIFPSHNMMSSPARTPNRMLLAHNQQQQSAALTAAQFPNSRTIAPPSTHPQVMLDNGHLNSKISLPASRNTSGQQLAAPSPNMQSSTRISSTTSFRPSTSSDCSQSFESSPNSSNTPLRGGQTQNQNHVWNQQPVAQLAQPMRTRGLQRSEALNVQLSAPQGALPNDAPLPKATPEEIRDIRNYVLSCAQQQRRHGEVTSENQLILEANHQAINWRMGFVYRGVLAQREQERQDNMQNITFRPPALAKDSSPSQQASQNQQSQQRQQFQREQQHRKQQRVQEQLLQMQRFQQQQQSLDGHMNGNHGTISPSISQDETSNELQRPEAGLARSNPIGTEHTPRNHGLHRSSSQNADSQMVYNQFNKNQHYRTRPEEIFYGSTDYSITPRGGTAMDSRLLANNSIDFYNNNALSSSYGGQQHSQSQSHDPQGHPGLQRGTSAASIAISGSESGYKGVACVNCHLNWWNKECDDHMNCENCIVLGIVCERPRCERAAPGQCAKNQRCSRVHEDDRWDASQLTKEFKKDLKRRGKKTDDHELSPKRRRIV